MVSIQCKIQSLNKKSQNDQPNVTNLVVLQPEQYFLDFFRRSIILNPQITSNKHSLLLFHQRKKNISFLKVHFLLTNEKLFQNFIVYSNRKKSGLDKHSHILLSNNHLFVHKWNYKVGDVYLYKHKTFTNGFL